MMGSAYKSKAMISASTAQKINAYKQAALFYYKAYAKQKKAYSLINWLEIENILVLLDKQEVGANCKNRSNGISSACYKRRC